jgi:RHH-type proline utilization regulon transcriptional repressor/proline dehydrogenase/delta 1-pyrroline-5-carboxylate dehydrogenase
MTDLAPLRARIAADHLAPEVPLLDRLIAAHAPDAATRARAADRGAALVTAIRTDSRPGLMEVFLAEYGLSTDEGIALMCLAEALLRVPDPATMDDLIEDKIAPSEWGRHLGHSSSPLVNASTWALMLTGKVLAEDREPGIAATLRGAVKRLGEPVIRAAVQRAMKEMGQQFVLGETIADAIRRGRGKAAQGFTFSYDMLGEAAMTAEDAAHYLAAYRDAIAALAAEARSDDIRQNPGISIKLSALHPRYEEWQRARVMAELAPVVLSLAQQAKAARMGLNIDAEEADRLELSLDLIEAVLSDPSLAGWDGFGVVVQGYGKRAAAVIDWLHAVASRLDRRIMVRLVKGAYWDTEIKRAQVDGFPDFPVWTRKTATDVAYICCASKLLGMTDRIYPQFATHNAHTAAAILEIAGGRDDYEFQRLHGMGEALHDILVKSNAARSRIYAPVGAHRDLLAYLVRRLLENGANSSFVNQVVDTSVPAAEVAADPFDALGHAPPPPPPGVDLPRDLFAPRRPNSRGVDLRHPATLAEVDAARAPFRAEVWEAAPLLAGPAAPQAAHEVRNPANPADLVGKVADASPADVEAALAAAERWDAPPQERAEILNRAADLYETHMGEIFALLAREAGKTLPDALAELREAVDFLRYYASFATADAPRGTIACISPWNFPLAIFTGQIAGALAAGNAVVAKPAEATPLIAHRAVELMHEAGVPREALQFLPGTGATVGRAITSDPRVAGVVFTGSTATAKRIDRAMAATLDPFAPLVAETGGINAMIVDSTALPEQAVRDIVASAFRSAGQRCSALRCLYVQEDVADRVLTMLEGAMRELSLGDPWDAATDVGPIISEAARDDIAAHVEAARRDGRLIAALGAPGQGAFLGPAMIRVRGIADLAREVFGPVLHVATFRAADLDRVVAAINATGYGLTFGLHTRIDDRVERLSSRLRVGNVYVNRNQIGAVVGSQPFGGEGLSGTGPKAGGPAYVARFRAVGGEPEGGSGGATGASAVRAALAALAFDPFATLSSELLPGPTGEMNRLTTHPRGPVLCLGPGAEAAAAQAAAARAAGCPGVEAPGLDPEALRDLPGLALAAYDGPPEAARACREALAARPGPIVPLLRRAELEALCRLERHLCIDTTASGGNATLLAASA